jgi:hypothetical protein
MTASVTDLPQPAQLPRLRLLPPPRVDGPYDDEQADPIPPLVDGSLALSFPPPCRVTVPLRLVPPAECGPRSTASFPDARRISLRLARALAEVLAGARPPQQLCDVASLDVMQQLERNAGRLGGRRSGPPAQPRVLSVHVSEPGSGIAEACAVVDTGMRRRALAFRVEIVRGGWRCTAVNVG